MGGPPDAATGSQYVATHRAGQCQQYSRSEGCATGYTVGDPTVGRPVPRYIARRVLWSVPVLIVSSILVFVVIRGNGDFVDSLRRSQGCDDPCRRAILHDLGLDKSGPAQYVGWFTHFIRGQWGNSLLTNDSVAKDIREALWNTLVLGSVAIVFSLIVGVAIGMYSALHQYSLFDHLSTGAAFIGLSIPNFWFSLMLQILFGVYLSKWFHLTDPIFYITGMFKPGTTGFHFLDRIRHITLPATVLAVQIIAIYSRYMRASMLEIIQSDFMRTARAKGLSERRVIVRHAMRNALIPLTTQLAIDMGTLAGGLIITEQIFQWPGMGRFFITAFSYGDYPQVLASVMIIVSFVMLFNLLADIAYAFLDPRIRYA
jgi:peptide/nickel transport system permease protein